jgi:NAD(P)-dependent dehydrogenase (short-subunit alcohol dehydrogenase family)
VNYLSHFLLTELLLPVLKSSAPSRIVNVSSKAHFHGKKYDFDDLKKSISTTGIMSAYGNSKLANALHAKKLSQLLKDTGVTSYSLHPGVVATDVWRHIPSMIQTFIKFFMLSEEKGAMTQLYCATEPSIANESGLYYDDCKVVTPNSLVLDQVYMDEFWNKSLELIKDYK